MKDKVARDLLIELAGYLGYQVIPGSPPYITGDDNSLPKYVRDLRYRLDALDGKFAALKESAKPVCKTCGQKVQDGFKAGQIETLAAGVKRKR